MFCFCHFLVNILFTLSESLVFFPTPFQLDLATSGTGGIGNYIGVCAIVGCFGVGDAIVQGGMTGDLSFMCPEFIQVRGSSTFNFVLPKLLHEILNYVCILIHELCSRFSLVLLHLVQLRLV